MNPDRMKLEKEKCLVSIIYTQLQIYPPHPEKKTLWRVVNRAVKKFLSGRLIMNGRRLWNWHQRHKFLRAEATRDILKSRVSEMPFPGVFKRQFPPWMPYCFVRIHARLRTRLLTCFRCSTTTHGSNGQI